MKRRNFIKLLGVGAAIPLLPQLNFVSGGVSNNSSSGLIKTGIHELDEKIVGFQPGELVIIAGRPAMGKTQVAIQIARECALRNNLTVAFFSIESSKKNTMFRIMAQEAKIPIFRIKSGEIKSNEWTDFINASNKISTANVFIDDTGSLTTQYIQKNLDNLAIKIKADIVIVDYLQLMTAASGKNKSRIERISSILIDLKQIAVKNNLCIIGFSQLNSGKDVDSHPMLQNFKKFSSLTNNSALNSDAVDKVIILFRERYYDESLIDNKIEYHIVKNKSGTTGVVTTDWPLVI